ncbi:MAG: (2Fe-2S)-binding protein [Burkholderiaceae bacterium]|jgi:Rieske Fe-S protein|nr:(2Fe-2S)-binding protein [Burkholderiaceae bacterium]
MQRRDFLFGCAAAATIADPVLHAQRALAAQQSSSVKPHDWSRARLLDADGQPMKASSIEPRKALLFAYPFVGTPAFLIDLDKPTQRSVPLETQDDERYTWEGGVGPKRSIVAFSAICAHKMAYPTREITFINYRDEPSAVTRRAHVIHCCSEHSEYDPAAGARVLSGPATQPLAAIVLEHDARDDSLHAVGTRGGELFDRFFERFAMKLSLEHGGDEHRPVGASTTVVPIERYCRQLMRCN